MNSFNPPINGTKIGELRFSLVYYMLLQLIPFYTYLFVSACFSLIYLLLKQIGTNYFNPLLWEWHDTWINQIAIIWFVTGLLFFWFFNSRPLGMQLHGRSFSLFFVKNEVNFGLEINNYFIPFLDNTNYSGIYNFKINSEFLMFQTHRSDYPENFYSSKYFVRINWLEDEKLKFKLEPEYLPYKRELLTYLNTCVKDGPSRHDLLYRSEYDKSLKIELQRLDSNIEID
jgi:hypothetical protein